MSRGREVESRKLKFAIGLTLFFGGVSATFFALGEYQLALASAGPFLASLCGAIGFYIRRRKAGL